MILESQTEIQINPILKMKNDIMFKAFFSRKENEDLLKDMLEAILGKKIKIKKIIHDARLEQLAKEQKYGILDLDVELEDGEIINVEMQLKNYHNIEERTTFYASKKIVEQLGPGTKYEEMKKVIVIAILNYSFLDVPEYVTETVRVARNHRDYEINNTVTYYYIELEKFRRQNPDMTEPLNQWLAFLDMERGELLEMAKKENKKIAKAIENYEVLTGDEEVKRLAEIRLMSELEEKSALASARDAGMKRGTKIGEEIGIKKGEAIGRQKGEAIGRQKGEAIGRQKGEAIGRQKGEAIGRQKGEKESKEKIARKLLDAKMPIEQIIEITELTEEEVQRIVDETKPQ